MLRLHQPRAPQSQEAPSLPSSGTGAVFAWGDWTGHAKVAGSSGLSLHDLRFRFRIMRLLPTSLILCAQGSMPGSTQCVLFAQRKQVSAVHITV